MSSHAWPASMKISGTTLAYTKTCHHNNYYIIFTLSRHTVVCRAAQEAGVPPVSILTGRKKTQFSHLCSSVIPYPIGTKFAREVPAGKGSLHTKFEENRSSHFRDTSEQNFVLISWFFSSSTSSFLTFAKSAIKHEFVLGSG